VITYRSDEGVAEWTRERIPGIERWMDKYMSFGVVRDDELVVGIVYDAFTGTDINMHQVIEDHRGVTRASLKAAFSFPFVTLNCQRVTGLVPSSNLAAQRLNAHFGFILEGRKRHAFPNGDDELIYGLLKSECRWLR